MILTATTTRRRRPLLVETTDFHEVTDIISEPDGGQDPASLGDPLRSCPCPCCSSCSA